nr:hypothetical protein BdHM001_36110 [Bdellovibrio sp. HM001]
MYYLSIERVRLDLGGEKFVDVSEAVGTSLFEDAPLASLLGRKLKLFVEERHGQIIDADGDTVVFDTADTTITARLKHRYKEAVDERDFAAFLPEWK